MDFSEVTPGDWLMIAGGAAMLVFGVALDWASFGEVTKNDAFDYFLTGGIAYILVSAAGLVAFLIGVRLIRPGAIRWPLILLIATGTGTLLMVIRLILGAGDEVGFGSLDRSSGMYIAFLAAAVAFAGALMNFLAPAGDDEYDDYDYVHHSDERDEPRGVSRSSDRRSDPPAL